MKKNEGPGHSVMSMTPTLHPVVTSRTLKLYCWLAHRTEPRWRPFCRFWSLSPQTSPLHTANFSKMGSWDAEEDSQTLVIIMVHR
ncbi:Hypothetical predicted protein [Paramuricea clavata]|uniref:Uncharacterized protein n=1 Tax=Paramuricea clavata TaxID=317549 RepID=A0A6S7I3Y3_PARCT|nr:Hypothetical predicted protein [Paramuricea clavata]